MTFRAGLLSLVVPAVLSAQATVHVTTTNYAFDAPDTVASGLVTIALVNKGPELHHVQIVRFENGKTLADFAEAMKNPGPPPSWVTWIGGPNAVIPDGVTTGITEVSLAPGNYAYICLVPASDGMPHVMKGMARPFVVTAASGAMQAGAPRVDETITLFDYNFTLAKPLTAGHHVIAVHNNGPQMHELLLVKLNPGVTADSIPKWVHGGMQGPPPGMPLGGTTAISPNGTNRYTVDLMPGEYALYCFLPDAKDGQEHVMHGMLKPITVK